MSWGSAAFVALWVAHAAMNVYGLTGVWSKTYMEYYVAGKLGSADAPEQVLLYKSTFWDNVKQFWQSEAEAVAVLTFFNGICQPSQDRASMPIFCSAMASSPTVTCSPVATIVSYSRASCIGPISRAHSTSWLVVPAIAETTTAT